MLGIVAKQYILQHKCLLECPPRNMVVQLSTPYTDPEPSNSPPQWRRRTHMLCYADVMHMQITWQCLIIFIQSKFPTQQELDSISVIMTVNCLVLLWPGRRWGGRDQQPRVWTVWAVIRKGQV